jgi:uncharacterized membrane protein YciS (DUF1049 family)
MNSSLVISGYALYVFMFFFAVLIIGLIILGNSYMKEAIKNDKLEGRIRNLVNEYEKLQHNYYKATFKVPEVNEVSKKRGGKNV